MLRPNFEEPLDSAQQLVENNINIAVNRGGHIFKHILSQSSLHDYNKLAKTMYVPTTWEEETDVITYKILGNGTHAFLGSYMIEYYLKMAKWHRSQEKLKGIHPFAGYISNKKWHLNEVE